MTHVRCPVCNSHLRLLENEEKESVKFITKYGKYTDEDVYWCGKCGEYIFEEDFFYSTEEN